MMLRSFGAAAENDCLADAAFPFSTLLISSGASGTYRVDLQYLKITEKVSFNIASEASYVYILSGQRLIQNAKNGPLWRVFEKLKLAVKQCYQTGQF